MYTRLATPDDIASLLVLSKEFVGETNYPWTYSGEQSYKTFMGFFKLPTSAIIVVIDNNKIVGAALMVWDQDFIKERIGYLIKFYIRPGSRGTKAGRTLAEAMTKWFDDHNCTTSFATSTAGVGESKQFENLLKKFNFDFCGPTMMRNVKNG